MKVHTIQRRINHSAVRVIAICSAILMGFASSQATAQSALMNYLSTGSNQAGYAAAAARQVSHEGQAYRVVDAGTVKTVGSARTRRGPIGAAIAGDMPVQQTSCVGGSCGGGSYGSSCGGACGGSCGSYSANGMGQYGSDWACGTPCEPYCYGVAEYLYMERAGNRGFTFTGQFGSIEEFDFESGTRLTIGSVPDCVHGCEATFAGVFEWDRAGRQFDAAGGLVSILSADPSLQIGALSPFNDQAVDQRQLWESEYWSIEGNKTLVGWDVAKLLIGFRYLEFNETFNFSSLNLAGDAGRLFSDVENKLAGLQIGLDLLYPVGRFTYADFRSRAGIYGNFAESNVQLSNSFQGNVIANFDETTSLAGVFEVGGGYRIQLGEMLAIRGGTEILYISGIGKAPSQIPSLVSPFIGRSVRTNDDVFIYGLSVGAELRL